MDLKDTTSEGSLQPSSIQIFANTSTLHGIRHIFVYGPLTIRRVLWAVAFMGSLGLLLVESSERISFYFSYQHVTKVDEVVAHSLVFPAVTVCNLNGFRFSRLTTNDLYHAGELLALLDVNLDIPNPHLADPTVLEALREKANFKHYKPKVFSMREFLERVGHDLKDMMLYCKFKGQECGHQDFTTVRRYARAGQQAMPRAKAGSWGRLVGQFLGVWFASDQICGKESSLLSPKVEAVRRQQAQAESAGASGHGGRGNSRRNAEGGWPGDEGMVQVASSAWDVDGESPREEKIRAMEVIEECSQGAVCEATGPA
ncbi:acid-sensing ion channel 2-like [Vombatus ursinus]|uniref:acid-sensing ion channel 2-like n=1 Tax=Vombatus ursinus TaxID=29139 RepID=UPI000FFCDFE9|nr:acid-sensing ion channel 2-like [Vombatus ursinus]XP_027718234.1 acid-sensing ion channel 2-like [Vombatus ursinus]